MDKSKKGKKNRQQNAIDDESVGAVEEQKLERNSVGKSHNVGVDSDDVDSAESDTERKQPSKLTKNAAGGKNKKQPVGNDEESEDSDNEKKVSAKQSKSNTKKKNKKESREEEVIEEASKVEINDVKSNQKKDKKGTTKNSQKKKQEESDEDDHDDEVDHSEVIVTKKGVQTMKPSFQMLAMESSEDEKEDEDDSSDASVEVKKPEAVNQKKGKKAKPEKKKVKPADDEDIDKLVAEISNASQKKKGNKKKDQAVNEDKPDNHVIEAKPEVTITSDMTQEQLYKALDEMAMDDDDTKAKKKKGKKQQQESSEHGDSKDGDSGQEDDGDDTSTVKSVAQKKKEKKERQKAEKQKKTEVKGKEKAPAAKEGKEKAPAANEEKDSTEKRPESKEDLGKEEEEKMADKKNELIHEKETQEDEQSKELGEAEDTKTSKKDKKKKKDDKDKEKDKGKKPSKMVQEILERQKKMKEEEERLKLEEEERIRKEEEAIRLKEEEEQRIKERKEKLKQKKKEKIERKKQEGTFLTEKQKADKRRLMHMVEVYQMEIPDEARAAATEKKPPRYEKKKPKQNRQVSAEEKENGSAATSPIEDTQVEPVLTESEKPDSVEIKEEEIDEVKDAWDLSSAEEEEEEEEEEPDNKAVEKAVDKEASVQEAAKREERSKSKESASEEEEQTSEEEESEDSEDSSSEDDDKTPHEKPREKALARIKKRKEEAEAKRSLDKLRAPVVCVLGHVDTGKTKILDKLRRTNVQDGEAGGITQQIGATNVPQETIKEQTKMCKEFVKQELKLPGLLIIDTPGHESFSNLRNRGSSLCDIAILVVDIMHGLEPQTIESMNLLKAKKTPFLVALNKIDRLYGWQTNPHSDIINTLNRQKPNTRMEFNDRTKEVIVQFAEQGLNATLFHENKNPREYISLVPTSAHTGDGIGNLIALICDLTQNMLAKRLMFSEELKATVMEVKTIHGLGTTIDVILVSGRLHEGDTIVVAGQEGPIVTQIRALLMPQPLRELRVKSQYEHHKEVVAAQGCKIIAKDLEKALAGLPLFVAPEPDEGEIYKEELSQMLKDVLGDVKVSDKGVYVQASTLGSLEALLQFLKTSEIPFAGINIGPVHRKDIMKASVMLEHEQQYAVVLAFDVKVEHEAQTMADSLGVRIFTADIIYHLFDSFTKYREDFKKQKREEFKNIAVFPCKLRIMPQYIFNSRDPIVVGVIIEAGFLKEGTLLCVPSKEFVDIGRVSSIEVNHKTVDRATKGQEVCVKIDPIPGEAPKMFGRHFEATDLLVSKITRQSIDAVKNYFREEMSKTDWQLIMELKKTFEIL